MLGIGHSDFILGILWDIEQFGDVVVRERVDEVLRDGMILEIEEADVDEGVA
jgi:hypothetical protein